MNAAFRSAARIDQRYGPQLDELVDGDVLEIGPGRGELLEVLTQRNHRGSKLALHAIDIEQDVIDALARRYPEADLRTGDALQLIPAMNCRFRAVFLLQVLEHLEPDLATRLLATIREHLQDGGYLLLEVPNCASSFVGNTIQSGDITHRTAYNSVSLAQVCRAAGFESIQVYGHRPQGWSPARLVQRFIFSCLVTLDRMIHKIMLPSWNYRHEPVIYALCRK